MTWGDGLQRSKHVAGRDRVDSDASVRPLNRQARSEMSDRRLGRIVWCLRLRDVDDRSTHTSNHDHAAIDLALHEMLGDSDSEEVGTINIDAPELLDTVVGIGDGVKVLGKAS